ncbi:hypothetical protein ARALYDRAFT_887322 [Arabidopsis lyrata subsp. lyrata]|uniref:Transcription factor n=1 Tax=Arabidopsis lyrata subsp. lyrata TaxID=81972 RepID=D7KQ87_ARALL|nr:hypothetical protein ARALYDRAFT_887322 [Arabidopsis lyrata subsp. lyrata]
MISSLQFHSTNSLKFALLPYVPSEIAPISLESDINVQTSGEDVTVRINCPLESHPASRIFHAFEETKVEVMNSNLEVSQDTVLHTFVVKSEELTKEKLISALSREPSNSVQSRTSSGR